MQTRIQISSKHNSGVASLQPVGAVQSRGPGKSERINTNVAQLYATLSAVRCSSCVTAKQRCTYSASVGIQTSYAKLVTHSHGHTRLQHAQLSLVEGGEFRCNYTTDHSVSINGLNEIFLTTEMSQEP